MYVNRTNRTSSAVPVYLSVAALGEGLAAGDPLPRELRPSHQAAQ